MARRQNTPQKRQELITFGRRLKMWRKKRNLTQEKLAALADIDYTHYNELENAKVEPGLLILIKLANALEISPAAFFLYQSQLQKFTLLFNSPQTESEH